MSSCSRRQVIKRFVLGAAFSNVIGRSWSQNLLVHLQSTPSNQNGFMRLNLADYPELQEERGSVRISTSSLDPRSDKQVGLFPPVIINRGDNGEFYVMSAACTHEDCIVRRLDKASNLMVCPCHGSQYEPDGNVVHGPAQQPLRRFNFTHAEDTLTIEIPDVFYEMSVEKVPGSSRVKISFLAFEGLTYELYFRSSLAAPPERVSFATSPEGPTDQREIEIPGDFASVYVDRTARVGIYEIAMKTQKV